MRGFVETINQGAKGLVLGNSLFVPFRMELLSIWVGKEMSMLASPDEIVDLCEGNGDVAIREGAGWTNIVFRRYRDLGRELGGGKGHVILYATEKGEDPFAKVRRHHIRIGFGIHEQETSLEIVDDPFQL